MKQTESNLYFLLRDSAVPFQTIRIFPFFFIEMQLLTILYVICTIGFFALYYNIQKSEDAGNSIMKLTISDYYQLEQQAYFNLIGGVFLMFFFLYFRLKSRKLSFNEKVEENKGIVLSNLPINITEIEKKEEFLKEILEKEEVHNIEKIGYFPHIYTKKSRSKNLMGNEVIAGRALLTFQDLKDKEIFILEKKEKPLIILEKIIRWESAPLESDLNYKKLKSKQHTRSEKILFLSMIILGMLLVFVIFVLISLLQIEKSKDSPFLKNIVSIILGMIQLCYVYLIFPLKINYFFNKLFFISVSQEKFAKNLVKIIGALLFTCVFFPLCQPDWELFLYNSTMHFIIAGALLPFCEIMTYIIKKHPFFKKGSSLLICFNTLLFHSTSLVTCIPIGVFMSCWVYLIYYILRKYFFPPLSIKKANDSNYCNFHFWQRTCEFSIISFGMGSVLIEAICLYKVSISNTLVLVFSIVFFVCPLGKIVSKLANK